MAAFEMKPGSITHEEYNAYSDLLFFVKAHCESVNASLFDRRYYRQIENHVLSLLDKLSIAALPATGDNKP